MKSRTIKRDERILSPWVRLVERTVTDGKIESVFHSLAQADYVCIVAVTPKDELVCVSQYRPAVDSVTLELPAGLLGPEEAPLDCAVRELAEETGFAPLAIPTSLGFFFPDTGRLENRFWTFFTGDIIPLPDFSGEAGVARRLVPLREIPDLIADGRFGHALHIAALGLAVMRGAVPALSKMPWPHAKAGKPMVAGAE